MTAGSFQIEELVYRKARLRDALSRHIKAARYKGHAQRFLDLTEDESTLSAEDRLQCVFANGRYAWDWQYNGFVSLEKHFFPADRQPEVAGRGIRVRGLHCQSA